jgi:hypothetical protein
LIAMARKRTMPRSKSRRWRIHVIKGKRADYLGKVAAPDADAAIRAAIEAFGVTDRERQRRLTAQPVVE